MIDSSMRINGIYKQRQDPYFMLRVKLPGGVLSAPQAELIASLSERFARGLLHLTTRCSIELHWLEEHALPQILEAMTGAGLTSRGACGGAVRGISISNEPDKTLSRCYVIAAALQKHFTGNSSYEGLPKKFKIGIQSGYQTDSYLIQDVGIVLLPEFERPTYDVWIAGGLGREPQSGYMLAREVSEERLLPLIEGVVSLYRELAPPGKRLKHVAAAEGKESLAAKVIARALKVADTTLYMESGNASSWPCDPSDFVEVPVFAGELSSEALSRIAEIAQTSGTGQLYVTSEQNMAIAVSSAASTDAVQAAIAAAGLSSDGNSPVFKICPGSHECRLGLAPTRDVAAAILPILDGAQIRSWAISGCANSCSQPQLADVGIVTVRLTKIEGGQVPLFDLYRKTAPRTFGVKFAEAVSMSELLEHIRALGKP